MSMSSVTPGWTSNGSLLDCTYVMLLQNSAACSALGLGDRLALLCNMAKDV